MTIPTDPLFAQQWHLHNIGQSGGVPGVDLNVLPVWADYTGRGVVVGVVDTGVDLTHPDLDDNLAVIPGVDPTDLTGHGTAVAGLIAAEAGNGIGGVGVAFDATIEAYPNGDGQSLALDALLAAIGAALEQQVNVDVSNNSYGFDGEDFFFFDDFNQPEFQRIAEALATGVAAGRDGLGTVFVFANGNDFQSGNNANYHNLENSRYTIAVGAVNDDGTISSYSTPGAPILVSAFGSEWEVVTTDITGAGGYNPGGSPDDDGNYGYDFAGTSVAAPMVSGVVALMLEANPNLGYRDVQEILAYSARLTDPASLSWSFNGAENWNGGGLHVSHDFGFGLVDAHAAVRLAETWTTQHTAFNELVVEASSAPGAAIPDFGTFADFVQINLPTDLRIDHIEVELNIQHDWIGDLVVTLISPDGTESVLVDRPGRSEDQPGGVPGNGGIEFTTSSTHHWGETANGIWTLAVTDANGNDVGTLEDWTLRLYGDEDLGNDTFIFTDEFANVDGALDPRRTVLTDPGGVDTINAAPVTSNLVLDLTPGATSAIAGNGLVIDARTVVENAFAGDGNDIVLGNGVGNVLLGGRGADVLFGGAGRDLLEGGADDDVFIFAPGCDLDAVLDFEARPGGGDIIDMTRFGFGDFAALAGRAQQLAEGVFIGLGDSDGVLVAGVQGTELAPEHFLI